MKKYKLAIVAPTIGVPSETFIMRHMAELAPNQTVVIVDRIHPSFDQTSCNFPIIDLSNYWKGLHSKIIRYIARKLNLWRPHHQFIPAKKFLREYGVQVILGEYLNSTHPWIKIAKDLDLPIFAHAHGYDMSQCIQDEEWRTKYLNYNETKGIITMSQASRSRLIEIGLKPDKIHVVPYGINVPSAPLHRNKSANVKCFAVGRMKAKKAPLKLLESFRLASEKYSQLHLEYIGDGDLLPNVKKYIQKWNLEDKVTLHGVQSNQTVLKLMQEADIFIQHSITDPETGDEEGLPVAILEAMAHSLPVVSTIHAGIPEAVLDGETGFLVKEGDTEGMADAIYKLSLNFDLRKIMGAAAWQRAKKHYSWTINKSNILNIIGVKF